MNEKDVFILADEALNAVVGQIRDDQWDSRVPDDMAPRQPGMTLRQIIDYHAYDDAWVPDVLEGKTIDDVDTRWDGDLLGDHPKLNFASIVETAVMTVRGFDDLDRSVHLSYGDFPAREYLKHITSFRGLRVYDIARVHRRRHHHARRSRAGVVGRDRTRSRAVAADGRLRPGRRGPGDRAVAGPLAGPHGPPAALTTRREPFGVPAATL